MEEIARVYADALFEAAQDADKLDEIHEQLDEFADAMNESNDMRVFFFSPYFSSAEKREAISAAVSGAEPTSSSTSSSCSPRSTGCRRSSQIRRRFDELWAEANKRLEVTLTSAVELDQDVVEQVGDEVERQTDREIDIDDRGRPGHPRRARAAGRQHGPRREPAQQAGKTEKGSRLGGLAETTAKEH